MSRPVCHACGKPLFGPPDKVCVCGEREEAGFLEMQETSLRAVGEMLDIEFGSDQENLAALRAQRARQLFSRIIARLRALLPQ